MKSFAVTQGPQDVKRSRHGLFHTPSQKSVCRKVDRLVESTLRIQRLRNEEVCVYFYHFFFYDIPDGSFLCLTKSILPLIVRMLSYAHYFQQTSVSTSCMVSSDFEDDPNILDIVSDINCEDSNSVKKCSFEKHQPRTTKLLQQTLCWNAVAQELPSKSLTSKRSLRTLKLAPPIITPPNNDVGTQTTLVNSVDVATQTGELGSVSLNPETLETIVDDKVYTRCPECFQFNSYLSRHLRVVHNYSTSEAAYYRANFKKCDNRSGHVGKAKPRSCPVEGCVAKVINVKRHLTSFHKMSEERQTELYGYKSRLVV